MKQVRLVDADALLKHEVESDRLKEEDTKEPKWTFNTDHIVIPRQLLRKKIVISTDGVITSAKLYDGKKVVKLSCNAIKKIISFLKAIGAKIAFDRLIVDMISDSSKPVVQEKPKYWTGKVVCIEVDADYWQESVKLGRIYSVDNGRFLWDIPSYDPNLSPQTYTDVPGVKEIFTKAKFIELKT